MSTPVDKSHAVARVFEVSGKLPSNNRPIYSLLVFPKLTSGPIKSAPGPSRQRMSKMTESTMITENRLTLQDVLDGVKANPTLSDTRRRDLRSAVTSFAALTANTPSHTPLDLAAI